MKIAQEINIQGDDVYDSECDSEHSSRLKQAETPEHETEGVKIDIIQVGEIVQYTIPSFPVLTVYLRHCVTSVWDNTDENVKIFHVFLRKGPDIVTNIPSSVEVTESCNINVSQHTCDFAHHQAWLLHAKRYTPVEILTKSCGRGGLSSGKLK